MKKPSPQFISKLENELRLAYRAQYQNQQPETRPFGHFFRFFVPALSGALVLVLVLLNFKGNLIPTNPPQDNQQNQQTGDTGESLVTFNEGAQEEQIVQDFDNDELSQIDSGVKLVAESNYN